MIGIDRQAEKIIAGGDIRDVQPLAIQAIVVNIFPSRADSLMTAGVLAGSVGIDSRSGFAVSEAKPLFSRDDGPVLNIDDVSGFRVDQGIFHHVLEMKVSVAGADMKMRVEFRIPQDDVLIPSIDDVAFKTEELAGAWACDAFLDDGAIILREVLLTEFDRRENGRFVDAQIRAVGRATCSGISGGLIRGLLRRVGIGRAGEAQGRRGCDGESCFKPSFFREFSDHDSRN